MEKAKLQQFISKYNLGGEVDAAVWTMGDKLQTRFITGDKTLIGEVVYSGDGLDSSKKDIGIYDTTLLSKMLTVLGEDVEISLIDKKVKNQNRTVAMAFKDDHSNINYQLADPVVIPKVPSAKNLPTDYDLQIEITSEFTTRFVKAKSALDDIPYFTVNASKNQCTLTIGYDNENSNTIVLDVDAEGTLPTPMVFSSKILKEILVANKEFKTATLNVSSQGIAKIVFDMDEFESTYYIFPVNLGE